MSKRKLVLEDGTTFIGTAFGSDSIHSGEVIFYSGMTGYQEALSDPNYYGKMVVMTYPSIGNYGINRDDFEAITPSISGMIVKEICGIPSNFRSEETLHAYLKKHDIPGISGIDTRKLTRIIREKGTMRAIMMEEDAVGDIASPENTISILDKVSIQKPYIVPGLEKRIVVIDFGMKQSTLHELMERNCHITVVPYHCTKEEISRFRPDGILLSNGPGNPREMGEMVATVKSLIGDFPLFGIGLGHQLLALAYGATINRLFTGEYGVGFPVTDVLQDKTWLVTKSHDYYVDETSLSGTALEITHRSLHDGIIEGMKQVEDVVLSVQFNPEGAPGGNEMNDAFDTFLQMIEGSHMKNGGTYHA